MRLSSLKLSFLLAIFLVGQSLSLHLSAANEKDVAACIPMLRNLSFSNISKLPDEAEPFAKAMIEQYDLFRNPILAHVTLKVIGEEKLEAWLKAKISEDMISADLVSQIWDEFLDALHPDETNPDNIFELWKKAPNTFGDIKLEDYRLWQQIAREVTYQPKKTEMAIALLRVFMPSYIKFVHLWGKQKTPLFKNKNIFLGLGGGLGGLVLAAALDGGIFTLPAIALGLSSPLVKRFVYVWKKDGIANQFDQSGPTQFRKELEEKNLLPTSVEHFSRVLDRIVSLEDLVAIKPVVNLNSTTEIMKYGAFFSPLLLAFAEMTYQLQQNIYANLKTSDLQQRFPAKDKVKLEAALKGVEVEGIIREIERLRAGIIESREKFEILKRTFGQIIEKLSEFSAVASKKIAEAKTKDEATELSLSDRVVHLNELMSHARQIEATMNQVDLGIAQDFRYMESLYQAIMQMRMSQPVSPASGASPEANRGLPPPIPAATAPAQPSRSGSGLFQ